MAIYGITVYGEDVYGLSLPPAYLVSPMLAGSYDYERVLVTWKQPSGTIFRYRLLKNRYGYPVNENDGEVIYDSTSYPGSFYFDNDIIQGTYHYYAFYVLADVEDNIWIRSGLAATLATSRQGQGTWLMQHLPQYFQTIPQDGAALTDDASGNSQLQEFLNVIGWGQDYIKTQYQAMELHVNDPMFIPLDDLYNLAEEVGLSFSPEVPVYTVRKAVQNQAYVSQKRGTLQGLADEIELRTGYGADITMGPNIMLDDDQSQILSPIFLEYSASKPYQKNECIWVPHNGAGEWGGWNGDGYWYRSLVNNNFGNAYPTGDSSNGYWGAVYDVDDFTAVQQNPLTSNPGTWEVLDSTTTNGIPAPTPTTGPTLTQGLGVQHPLQLGNDYAWNALRFYNRAGSSRNMWCRSVCRPTTQLGTLLDTSFESGATIAPLDPDTTDFRRIPGNWPFVFCPNWMGGENDVSVPAYWTPVENCTFERTINQTHTGIWSLEVDSFGPALNPQSTAEQLPDPNFINPSSIATWKSWGATGTTFVQSNVHAFSGLTSLAISVAAGSWLQSPQIPAKYGDVDSCAIEFLSTAGSDFPVQLGIQYFDANGNNLGIQLGSSFNALPLGGSQEGTWLPYSVGPITAPQGAVSKSFIVYVCGTASFIDNITFTQTGETVSYPLELQSPWVTCPAGTAVTSSYYMKPGGTGGSAIATLQFLDQNGQVLASDAGSSVTLTSTSTWYSPSTSGTAPANTEYAALLVTVNGNMQQVFLDDVTITAAIPLNSQWPPEQIQAVSDGIPVPWLRPSQAWDASTEYRTQDMVLYMDQPFQALRRNMGSPPPVNNVASADWTPLSQSKRVRLCISDYTSQNMSNAGTFQYEVIPFVEWFDATGDFIARVFARNNVGGGAVEYPNNMAFDSFTTASLVISAGASGGTLTLDGWYGQYYNNTTLSGTPAFQDFEAGQLNYNWNGAFPKSGVMAGGWSASWTTSFQAVAAGSYIFSLQGGGGGGTQLIINGVTYINNWTMPSSSTLDATVTLSAGQTANIQVNYWAPFSNGSYGGNVLSSLSGYQTSFEFGFNGSPPGPTEWTSPLTSVTAGDAVLVTGNVGGTWDMILTVRWYNGATPNGQSQAFQIGPNLSFTCEAPPGTTQMTVEGEWNGSGFSYGPNLNNFSAQIAGPPASEIDFGAITTPAAGVGTTVTSPYLDGRYTDDGQSTWSTKTGQWTCGGYQGGAVWPTELLRSISVLTGPADTTLGVTFRTEVV